MPKLSAEDGNSVEDGIRELLLRELITINPTRNRLAQAPPEVPKSSLEATPESRPHCPLGTRLAVACSVAAARLQLGFLSLESLLKRLQSSTPDADMRTRSSSVRAAVEQYKSTRHLFFSADAHCLLDSLALLLFLRTRGIRPSWVFGVRAAPFAAHCWLQLGDLLLNDDLENVSHYVPIMVV